MKKFIWSEILAVIILFANSAVFAQPIISTTIDSEPLPYVVPGHRIALAAIMTDQKGIIEARCYFSTDSDGKMLYVPMSRQSHNRYQCTLPSHNDHITKLEYAFLVVNGERQVIRSAVFHTDSYPSEPIPKWQMDIEGEQPLHVFGELNQPNLDAAGVEDEYAVTALTDPSKRHGLLVDIYTPDEIPAEWNAAQGYFGGFVLESSDQPPRPIKGFGIGLGVPPNLKKNRSSTQD